MQLDLLSLQISAARIMRDSGMPRAADHADRVVESWSDRAYEFLVDFVVCSEGRYFMGEDVCESAESNGFPAPPDKRAWGPVIMRAWGPVIMRAFKANVIKRVGYGPARSSNLSPKCIWARR